MNLLKRIYTFITRANQILFFLGICIILASAGFALYREFQQRNHYYGPQVIIETAETKKDPAKAGTSITSVDVLYRDEITTIIGLWKSHIQKPNGAETAVFERSFAAKASGGGNDAYDGLVNLRIFKTGSSTYRNLLPSDGLIIDHNNLRYNHFAQSKAPAAFILVVVADDTNNDGVLTTEDDRALIIVDRAQEKSDLKISDYISHTETTAGKIAVKIKAKDGIRFLEVDLTTFETTEIPWQ